MNPLRSLALSRRHYTQHQAAAATAAPLVSYANHHGVKYSSLCGPAMVQKSGVWLFLIL